MSHVKVLAAAAVAVCLAGGFVIAQGDPAPQSPRPVTIEVAGAIPNVVSLQTAGAWPLTLRLMARKPLGIGTYTVPNVYPVDAQQAFVVFADPDACFSLSLAHDPDVVGSVACPGGTDETYVEFTPTINLPDLVKRMVGKVMPARLGARLMLAGWRSSTPGDNSMMYSAGPVVGTDDGSACTEDGGAGCDNYGYGASPNLPGLVILSDTGVGLVWDEGFNLERPGKARNLAGFVNSVAWTLNERIGWTSSTVTAHLNTPANLFMPVVRIDFNQQGTDWFKNVAYQIDGAPWVYGTSLTALRSVLNRTVTTVRVFVVNGRAPDVLDDLDADGVVTANDAELAGLTLLSHEVMFRFRTWHQEIDPALGIPFDTNGDGMQLPPAPAGPGGIRDIPR